ncbi:MAG: class I adenylate-forming enzyme family protein [Pseudomonadota bacterium]
MRPFLTLHDPGAAARFYASGFWSDDTFYSLAARHAAERPDAPALADGKFAWSWREVCDRADALAADLHGAGLVPGDRVSLWLGNHAAAVVAFIACSRGGYACNPSLHRTYTTAEILSLVERLGSAAFITEPGWGADRGDGGHLETSIMDLPSMRRFFPHPSQLPCACPPGFDRPAHRNPDSVAYMAFTSGTTGAPKCVMHSCNSLLANARNMVRDWQLGSDDRLLTLSPLSHHIAWVGVSQWLLSGCMYFTDDPPEGRDRLDWIIDTGATYIMGVPTHAMDVLALQRERGVRRMGAVRMFYIAGSAIPPTVAQAFAEQGIKPQNVYGMTENSSHQYTHPDDDHAIAINTCGRGGDAYRIRIFDPDDKERALPVGEIGEIGGQGAALMLGYFGNQDATAGSFNRLGWFMSGDLGAVDEHGNLTVAGRSKDLIIRGGHNIHPSHIEALALRHPALERVAAIPVPDERLGEKVCLAVVGEHDAQSLLTHLDREGLSIHDMPEYFLTLDAFPLTASGKVLKRDLIEQVRNGTLRPRAVRFVRAARSGL